MASGALSALFFMGYANAISDRYYANNILLLQGAGTSGSTTIVDESYTPYTATVSGNVQVSTALGFNSILFDGTGDYLTYSGSPIISNGDMTVEMFINLTTIKACGLIDMRPLGTTSGNDLILSVNVDGAIRLNAVSGTDRIISAAGVIAAGTTYHVAANRTGGLWTLYVNGVSIGTYNAGSAASNSTAFVVGTWTDQRNTSATGKVNGHIFGLRITYGVDRYPSAFTPPTNPLPNSVVDRTPNVVSSAGNGSGSTGVSAVNITMPSGLVKGNVLLLTGHIAEGSGTRTVGTPTGWFLLYSLVGQTNIRRSYAFWKPVYGNEGANVNLTASGNGYWSGQIQQIENWLGPPEATTASNATTQNPNPPAISPSWGINRSTMIIPVVVDDINPRTPTPTPPTGYTEQIVSENVIDASTAYGRTTTSRKTGRFTTEDPGTYTLSASGITTATTIAVHG